MTKFIRTIVNGIDPNTDCVHCWYNVKNIYTDFNLTTTDICCHCGIIKEDIIDIKPIAYVYPPKEEKKHGKYKLEITFRY